jgi:two-component system OmpR family sensor kinase
VTTQPASARVGEAQLPRIRLRLTVVYALTLLVVLFLCAAFLRLATRDALAREFDDSLRASAALVRQFFRVEVAEYREIDATLQHIAGELVFEDRAIHVHRPSGQEFTVVGSPRSPMRGTLVQPVRTLTVPLEPALAPGWMIVVEASAATVAAVNARIDRWILLGIPALVLLAAGGGWWLTGRTLRPVGHMADAAASIAPGSGQRIPIHDASDELGRLGTRVNDLLDRLDGTLTQQRRFLADAAHELRTPLSRVRGRVELAMQPVPFADRSTALSSSDHAPSDIAEVGVAGERARRDHPDALPAIHDEVVRMSVLVDELLQLARADADGDSATGSMAPLYLDDVVTDEIPRWRADADRAHVTLTCSAVYEAPMVGDALLMRRLLGIILDNAIRYSNAGGCIDLRVLRTDGGVVLEVQDEGIGIAPAERARLTERFYRGERARAHRSDGSGLGLAIAQWILERHGGTLSLTSNPMGVGVVARVTIPEAPPAAR